ncbi:MAG: chemotaxis protein CheZ [Flavobacteriales bacterium]|jgi:chemotaxis protein CheZ
MENQTVEQNDDRFKTLLQQSSTQLVDVLQNDNYDRASEIIHELLEARDKHIFVSVGKLTRGLHNAIVNFHVDADVDAVPPDIKNSEIRDASDRLHYVLKLTENAADKTMDKVEAIAPIAMNLGQEAHRLRDEWKKLRRGEISKEGFKELYGEMDTFFEQMGAGTDQLNQNLQDIILEQSYQDLTGQVLKKVIGLVTDVENELVNLIRIAGQVEEVTGLASEDAVAAEAVTNNIEAEGPAMHVEKREDVVNGQDDVDDLLSSLGF